LATLARSVEEKAQQTQRTVIRVAREDVVRHFYLEKLTRADKVAGQVDVGPRRLPVRHSTSQANP
jgi:hypothetical protein